MKCQLLGAIGSFILFCSPPASFIHTHPQLGDSGVGNHLGPDVGVRVQKLLGLELEVGVHVDVDVCVLLQPGKVVVQLGGLCAHHALREKLVSLTWTKRRLIYRKGAFVPLFHF